MFADDFSLFSSHPNKEVAEATIQESITNAAEWSRRRKQLEGGPLAALVTARWGPSHHNLSIKVPCSHHREGPFFRTACRRSNFQSL